MKNKILFLFFAEHIFVPERRPEKGPVADPLIHLQWPSQCCTGKILKIGQGINAPAVVLINGSFVDLLGQCFPNDL